MLAAANIFFQEFFSVNEGAFAFSGRAADNFMLYAYKTGIRDLREHAGAVVVSLGFASAPFYATREWSDHYSIAPETRPRRMIVSDAVLRQMAEDAQRYVVAFYRYLHSQGLLCAALCGPRPQLRHGMMEKLGPEKILRLVEVFEQPVRDALAELGCPLLELPETIDAQGLLREEYWGNDPAHANVAYGKLMLDRLDQIRPAGSGSSKSAPELPWRLRKMELAAQQQQDATEPFS